MRVDADMDTCMSSLPFNRASRTVPLPTPEGPEITNNMPFLVIFNPSCIIFLRYLWTSGDWQLSPVELQIE
jgi:hypothetical protein